MARRGLTETDRELGRALGAEIRRRRGGRAASGLAASGDVNLDTWRRVEQGRVPTPGFFLVADIAGALQVGLDELATAARQAASTETAS